MAHTRRFGLTHETLKREDSNPEKKHENRDPEKMGLLTKWLVRIFLAPMADELED